MIPLPPVNTKFIIAGVAVVVFVGLISGTYHIGVARGVDKAVIAQCEDAKETAGEQREQRNKDERLSDDELLDLNQNL